MVGAVSCVSGQGFPGDEGFVTVGGGVEGDGVCGIEDEGEGEGEGEKEVTGLWLRGMWDRFNWDDVMILKHGYMVVYSMELGVGNIGEG